MRTICLLFGLLISQWSFAADGCGSRPKGELSKAYQLSDQLIVPSLMSFGLITIMLEVEQARLATPMAFEEGEPGYEIELDNSKQKGLLNCKMFGSHRYNVYMSQVYASMLYDDELTLLVDYFSNEEAIASFMMSNHDESILLKYIKPSELQLLLAGLKKVEIAAALNPHYLHLLESEYFLALDEIDYATKDKLEQAYGVKLPDFINP